MTDIKELISQWVIAHKEELTAQLAALVAIKSVREDAVPGAPCGAGPKAALEAMLELCRSFGFTTDTYDGVVGTADLGPSPAALDILTHLDTVDPGEGWDTDPLELTEKDGCLYGRGTDDDKGPALEAVYALRCVRELGLPMKKGVRLIFGTGEETGMDDLPHYFKDHESAPMTFSPDSGFPLYNTEKGLYRPGFEMVLPPCDKLPRVGSVDAGIKLNIIPAAATAVVLGMSAEEISASASAAGTVFEARDVDGGCCITVSGVQSHAAWPEKGVNALTGLLALLSALPLADCAGTRALRALNELSPHGDVYGRALGIAQRDDISGPLTAAFTLLKMDGGGICGAFDCRVPLCAAEDNCRRVFEDRMEKAGFAVSGGMKSAHHVPAEGEFVSTLLACYEAVTGKKGECLSTGGATYVHDIEGGVAFGSTMPGFQSNLHGANERVNIEDMLAAVNIFALSIAEICCK